MDFNSITTKGGDSGSTSLADGSRRSKEDLLIEVLGEVDELHAALGMLKVAITNISQRDEVEWIEQILIRMGGLLSTPPSHPGYSKLVRIGHTEIEQLEIWQKDIMKKVQMPQTFILYGASESSARADMARAICRRAERRLVTLIRQRAMTDLADSQKFLNRLSDYLFVYARYLEDE